MATPMHGKPGAMALTVAAQVEAWRPAVAGLRLSANSSGSSTTVIASLAGVESVLVFDIITAVDFPLVRLAGDSEASKSFNDEAAAFAYAQAPRTVAELLSFAEARVAEILGAERAREAGASLATVRLLGIVVPALWPKRRARGKPPRKLPCKRPRSRLGRLSATAGP